MTVIAARLSGMSRIAFQLLAIFFCLVSLPHSLKRATSAANAFDDACPDEKTGGGHSINV
jgi:hypothetical protein